MGVICYLKQLLDLGFFHADPHPGNLIRTPDGRLAVLDFGLVSSSGMLGCRWWWRRRCWRRRCSSSAVAAAAAAAAVVAPAAAGAL